MPVDVGVLFLNIALDCTVRHLGLYVVVVQIKGSDFGSDKVVNSSVTSRVFAACTHLVFLWLTLACLPPKRAWRAGGASVNRKWVA